MYAQSHEKSSSAPVAVTAKRSATPANAQSAIAPAWERALSGAPLLNLQLPIQTKLTINEPGDAFEQEADHIAERVMRMPEPRLQRATCACGGEAGPDGECAACKASKLARQIQRRAATATPAITPHVAPPIVHQTLQSPGQQLDSGTRTFMETRFGVDFGGVRVHANEQAAESARAVSANAYTVGQNVVFANGRYLPATAEGKQLLAHELAHVMQQGAGEERLQRDDTRANCRTGIQPGAAHAYPEDQSRWPSGRYSVWGPLFAGEDLRAYADLSIRAWIDWRFSGLSAAVTRRIHDETIPWTWQWHGSAPRTDCQYIMSFPMALMNSLVALAGRDPAGRQAEARESAAGMPTLPSPEPIADEEIVVTAGPQGSGGEPSERRQIDAREATEQALDPTSIYERGANGANMPPFPARMDGPEMEVPRGSGTYTMNLDYAAVTSDPLLQIAYHMNLVSYHWELFDITNVVRAGLGQQGIAREARRLDQSPQATAAAEGATRQRAEHTVDQLSEETIRSWQERRDPRRAAEGGRAIDVVTRAWANELNLVLLPVSSIIAAGGIALGGLADLMGAYAQEREVAFPNREGYYMVRCIAQPAPRGPNQSEKRAASVRIKIVELRQAEKLARNVLETPDALIADLTTRRQMTSNAAEIQRIDAQIAAIREQSSGDAVIYLTHLVEQKQREQATAPSWQQGQLARELASLRLRLEQAQRHREGATGVHHRIQAAFTSVVTGETYPLMLELNELPVETGFRVRLMDLTVPDREPIERNGATREQAVRNAFDELRYHGDLGRGHLLVRMPTTWTGEPRELSLETGAASTAIVRRRLQDLATALLVLSLVVPGVGEVSAVIAAGLAVDRLLRRGFNSTLRLDAESISDTLAVLGAVAQGAQLVGRLQIARRGQSFVGALRSGDLAAVEAAAQQLESARAAGRILEATSTVTNAGGLIWGDLAALDQLARIEQEELDGRITHAEARRRRAEILGAAIRDHGILLAGAMRPASADRVSGVENTPHEATPPPQREGTPPSQHEGTPSTPREATPSPPREGAPARERAASGRDNETLPEPELERRAAESVMPQPGDQPSQTRPDAVRARFRTPDGLHDVFILNDGRIFRCSFTCAQLHTWYDVYLRSQPEGTRGQAATELEGRLAGLEARARVGENTPALQQEIGALDVTLREFIAPDVAAEVQRTVEGRGLGRRGEQVLTPDQARHLLRVLALDEIQALTGPEGLRTSTGLRWLANAPEGFLGDLKSLATRLQRPIEQVGRALEGAVGENLTQTNLLDVMNAYTTATDVAVLQPLVEAMVAGGTEATSAAGFLQRIARIRGVEGVSFTLPDMYEAFQRGDAILSHGPLQTGIFLEEKVGGTPTLNDGRLGVGTSGGRMPAELLGRNRIGVLDWVIIETNGAFRLVLGQEHTGLSGGRAFVFGAGRIRFDINGFVVEIDNQSGHYAPSTENLQRAYQFMRSRGILSPTRDVRVTPIER